jgi:hypothetical protein
MIFVFGIMVFLFSLQWVLKSQYFLEKDSCWSRMPDTEGLPLK